jgi:HSP90 family molecular chaperone
VQESVSEYEQLNTVKPLWTRSAKDVTDDEYNQFYRDAFREHQVH